jgi:hypothetical protein
MQKVILIIFLSLTAIFNDINSTYGTLLLGIFVTLTALINHSKISIKQLIAVLILVLSYIFSGIKTQSLEPTLLLIFFILGENHLQITSSFKEKLYKYLNYVFLLISVYQFVKNGIAYGNFINIYNIKQIYPNALALLGLTLMGLNKRGRDKSISYLIILLSQSRISIIIGAIYGFYEIFKSKIKSKKLIATFFLILSIFTVNTISKTNQSSDFNSIDQRIEHWKNTPKLINLKTALIGNGGNSFSYLYPQVQQIPENQSPHSHNIILNLIIEHGLIFTLIFISICIDLYKNQNKNTKTAMLLFLIHNLFDLNYQFPFTILLLLSALNQNPEKKLKHKSISTIIVTISLLIITNNFYYSHKDQLLKENQIEEYIKQSPLDTKQLLKLNTEKYIKQVFLKNPFEVDVLELMIETYPETILDKSWLDNYKNGIYRTLNKT